MMDRHYENKFAYFRINNEIVFVDVKADVVLDLEAATLISVGRLHIQRDQSYPVLLNIDTLSASDKPGRDYMAAYGWFLARRVGILASRANSCIIAKFYILISKPNVTTRIFSDTAAAVRFLESR